MGRAFEYRKERKMKRWSNMARVFTKIGREIAIAVKDGGPEPAANPRLRMAIQAAKLANMPKKNVESAIQRALSKDAENLEELVYEGKGPHGIAFMVECLSDNSNRTVATMRLCFSRTGGELGTSGSVTYLFERRGEFVFELGDRNLEELELDLIDGGADDIETYQNEEEGTTEVYIYTAYEDFGKMQKKLEDLGIEVKEASLQRVATSPRELTEEQRADVERLVERLEEEDDVQKVFTTMAE